MPGADAGRYVPQGRWNSGFERGQYVARYDLIQPLSANDGSRRLAASRGDRPGRVVGIGRKRLMHRDFVFVDESVPEIRWDAKYATWDNFTGKPVDGYLANRIVGTMALCAALQTAQAVAASLG